MSHFAMNTLPSWPACANAWTMCESENPSWSMAPLGAVFTEDSLTAGNVVPSDSLRSKDKSGIAQNFRDLCGIIAIGDTFKCSGGYHPTKLPVTGSVAPLP